MSSQPQDVQVKVAAELKALENFEFGDITKINRCLATIVLIVNIILPGVGTMIAGCVVSGVFGKGLICTGILQLITAACLVGWIWAIYTGVFFCKVAGNPEELFKATMQVKAATKS